MKYLEDLEQSALDRDIPIMQRAGLEELISELLKHQSSTVLEIGSAIGYSALMMVNNVDNLKVETIERDDERYLEAHQNIHDYHQDDHIILHHDDALLMSTEELQAAPYDCLFIDAAKAQYQKFFEKYIPYVKKDGFVFVDNLDFHGMIYDIDHIRNRNTRALVRKIKRFRDWIKNNDLYDFEYREIGDGICIITRKDFE